MARAEEFARRMTQLSVKFERKTIQKVNALALAIQRELIMYTPVDTGQAISNWTLTLGSPNDDAFPAFSPGELGSTRQLNIGSAYAQAMSAVSDRELDQDIWISNTLSYISKLNQGSSRQAPSGFVQSAVIRGISSTRAIKVL